MAKCDPYIFFDGSCAEAMRFYEQTLGGKLHMQTAEASPHTPPGMEGRILHANLELPGGATLMASDDLSGMAYEGMKGFRVSLVYQDAEEGKRIFDGLANGGQVAVPYGETFFAAGFGMLSDKFGTPWMVSGGMRGGA